MSRLLEARRETESSKPLDDAAASGDRGSSRSGLRKALAGLAVAGLAYVAARRLRRSDGTPSMGEVKETVGDVRSGEGLDIPIGETGETAEGGASGAEDADETGASGSGTTEGAIGNEPMPGEDISDAEIGQRAEEGAHEEPTEPGEMAGHEEIAEEVTDSEDEADDAEAADVEADDAEAADAEADDAETADAETDDADADETGDEAEAEAGESDEGATDESDDEENA